MGVCFEMMHLAACQPFSLLLIFSNSLVDMLLVVTAAVGTRFLCVLHHDLSAHIVAACSVATSGRLGGAGMFQCRSGTACDTWQHQPVQGVLYLPRGP